MTKEEIARMLGVSNVRVSVKYSNWDKMIEDVNGDMVNVNEIYPYKLLVFNADTNDLIASGALTHQVYRVMQKGGLEAIDIVIFERRDNISLINIKDKTLMEF